MPFQISFGVTLLHRLFYKDRAIVCVTSPCRPRGRKEPPSLTRHQYPGKEVFFSPSSVPSIMPGKKRGENRKHLPFPSTHLRLGLCDPSPAENLCPLGGRHPQNPVSKPQHFIYYDTHF